MQLTPEGRRVVEDVAQRHGVSVRCGADAPAAVAAGHGTSAQFSHPELGGMGQWSQGGMIMVGDMFNNALKYRVDRLCNGAVRPSAQLGAGMGGARVVAVAKLRWPGIPKPRPRQSCFRFQPVRPGCRRSLQLVAAGACCAVLDWCPEQYPLYHRAYEVAFVIQGWSHSERSRTGSATSRFQASQQASTMAR